MSVYQKRKNKELTRADRPDPYCPYHNSQWVAIHESQKKDKCYNIYGRSFFLLCVEHNSLLDEYAACCVCGFDKTIDLCHIKPRRKKGEYSFDNIIPLCPNHHRLFDSNKLEEADGLKIRHFIEKIKAIVD